MLMARGLSNADVGRELVLEAGTVKKHVANVLSKLDSGAGRRPSCSPTSTGSRGPAAEQ